MVVGLRSFVALGIVLAACGGRSTQRLDWSGTPGDDDPDGAGPREGPAGTGGRDGGGGSGGSGAGGGTATDPQNGGGNNRGGTGGSEIRGGIIQPGPEAGGSGATGTVAGTGGATGGTSTTDDGPGACTQDGIRLGIGGNLGQRQPPGGACVLANKYFCRDESYTIDSGPCAGTCTCLGDTNWSCSFDDTTNGHCEVDHCDVDGVRLDVGFGYIDSDGCTRCTCTRQGIVCEDEFCQAPERCKKVAEAYDQALKRAEACDPHLDTPQCTARATITATCSDEVPVMDTSELDEIKRRYAEDGCVELTQPCPPHIALGTHPTCASDGVCRSLP